MLIAITFLRIWFSQKTPKETLVLVEEYVRTDVTKTIMIVPADLRWNLFHRILPKDFPVDFPKLLLSILFHQIQWFKHITLKYNIKRSYNFF